MQVLSAPVQPASAPDPRAAIGLRPKNLPDPEPPAVRPVDDRPIASPEHMLVRNLVQDQKAIWTSPLRVRLSDVQWLTPLLGGTAIVMASDTDIQRKLPDSASFQKRSNSFSNYGVAAFAGATALGWMWGTATHNDHLRETAVLSGEAALGSMGLTYAIKNIAQRDRPFETNHHGNFFAHGDSFPSEHSAAVWSVASVVAHEYPGPLTSLFAYGGAAAISAARVTSGKHFASDALVGSAIGYFVGRQVYRAHSAREGMSAYGTFERAPRPESPRNPEDMGSSFVPLDSWVYGAMDRLAALGYIHSAFAGLRPWTRMEVARLLGEADDRIQMTAGTGHVDEEALRLYRGLQAEFLVESHRMGGDRNLSAELESVYTRFTGISGKPLNDSYHFGQTLINDYGRPYQEGFNMVTGFTSHAEAGPLAFYVRGEYQHAPSAPAYPFSVRSAISTMDANPIQPALPFAEQNNFRLLDTYVALNIKNNQISFGKQSLWWGPGQGGALMFSDNAAPFYMLRWNHVSPTELPSFLHLLGPMRTDFFIGKLEGHHFPSAPYITGQKISFRPTENLEIGFSKMSIFGGGGIPITWHNFYKAAFSVDDGGGTVDFNVLGRDAGDRRGGFDFSYRVPGLRNWLTIYSDSLVDDDPSPLAAPRRAAINPGLYLSHVPGLPKLDFRVEAVNTDPPTGRSVNGQFVYWNLVYHDSHLNAGNVVGDWIGREGKGFQAWSNYWLSAENVFGIGYRNAELAKDFVAGGGHLNDVSARANFKLNSNLSVSGWLQYEVWRLPLLQSASQSNITGSVQLIFRPRWHVRREGQ